MVATLTTPSADQLFRAFSDRTRLRILCLLRRGELCVCDLVTALGVRQPSISRHLASLRKAGIIEARKEGNWSYYRLCEPAGPLQIMLIGSLEAVATELPEAKQDAARLAKAQFDCCE